MACLCDSYICINVIIDPCSTGTELPILAPSSETWNGLIEFNGKWTSFGFEVVGGQNIVLPTLLFNEDYVHELRLTDADGINTCYKVNAIFGSVLSGFEPQPPISEVWQWGELAMSGNTISNILLGGEIAPIIWVNEQPINWVLQGVTHVGDTLDFTSIGGVFGTIIFQYRMLP